MCPVPCKYAADDCVCVIDCADVATPSCRFGQDAVAQSRARNIAQATAATRLTTTAGVKCASTPPQLVDFTVDVAAG